MNFKKKNGPTIALSQVDYIAQTLYRTLMTMDYMKSIKTDDELLVGHNKPFSINEKTQLNHLKAIVMFVNNTSMWRQSQALGLPAQAVLNIVPWDMLASDLHLKINGTYLAGIVNQQKQIIITQVAQADRTEMTTLHQYQWLALTPELLKKWVLSVLDPNYADPWYQFDFMHFKKADNQYVSKMQKMYP